jgi:hypothetical protein
MWVDHPIHEEIGSLKPNEALRSGHNQASERNKTSRSIWIVVAKLKTELHIDVRGRNGLGKKASVTYILYQ